MGKKKHESKQHTPYGIKGAKSIQIKYGKGKMEAYLNNILEKKALYRVNEYYWDAEAWRRAFINSYDPKIKRKLRQLVQVSTLYTLLANKYIVGDESEEDVKYKTIPIQRKKLIQSMKKTTVYPSNYGYNIPKGIENKPATVQIFEGDCLLVAEKLYKEGLNPLVLNMASASNGGGGYEQGAGAQEENLCRRSSLICSLTDPFQFDLSHEKDHYPIAEFGGIYTPDVLVFRGAESQGYPFLETPMYMAFVAVACYRSPPFETIDGRVRISGLKLRQKFVQKLETIFKVGVEHGHDSLVLSAIGAGAYRCPVDDIASIFYLLSMKYKYHFKSIAFAIIDDHNTFKQHNPRGNLEAFGHAFKQTPQSVE